MKVVQSVPPNYIEISDRFHLATLVGFNPVFAYGDTLYNPTGFHISEDLMVHEETHSQQQKVLGVEQWWQLYLTDDGFRLTQELEAYRNQFIYIKEHYGRQIWRSALQKMAKDLSSRLYGSIIKKSDAQELIENG